MDVDDRKCGAHDSLSLGQSIATTVASPVDVLFLTGQPGSGKTAVAKELGELLWQVQQPHAIIDLDELCRGVVPTPTPNYNRDLAAANLRAVWANFYARGVRRVILARLLESLDDLALFGSAIPHTQLTVCTLHTPASLVTDRLTEREPGSARAFLLGVTPQIAARMAELDLPGIRVHNGHRPITEVAREILSRIDWPCPSLEGYCHRSM